MSLAAARAREARSSLSRNSSAFAAPTCSTPACLRQISALTSTARRSQSHFIEAGRQREASIVRANQVKQEQIHRKQLVAEAEHVANEQARKEKVKKAAEEKRLLQLEYAKHNREEEEKRQVMLERVASQERIVRSRLASAISQAEVAVDRRKRVIAAAKESVLAVKAQETVKQLRRAQSAKAIREAQEVERIRAEALHVTESATCRQRAREAKEQERLVFVMRNAEEKQARAHALQEVQNQESR